MENTANNLPDQEEQNESTGGNNNTTTGDDTLGENTELTPLGKELEKDEESDLENSENDGKAAENPAPDDDVQLDIETVSP
jgi:hypothetical protein